MSIIDQILRHVGLNMAAARAAARLIVTRMSNQSFHDWNARAMDALAEAQAMPKGADRNNALKKAGQLRMAADMRRNVRSQITRAQIVPRHRV
jgi:hypothetical protein